MYLKANVRANILVRPSNTSDYDVYQGDQDNLELLKG